LITLWATFSFELHERQRGSDGLTVRSRNPDGDCAEDGPRERVVGGRRERTARKGDRDQQEGERAKQQTTRAP
jgi:hypothetical protein